MTSFGARRLLQWAKDFDCASEKNSRQTHWGDIVGGPYPNCPIRGNGVAPHYDKYGRGEKCEIGVFFDRHMEARGKSRGILYERSYHTKNGAALGAVLQQAPAVPGELQGPRRQGPSKAKAAGDQARRTSVFAGCLPPLWWK